MQKITSFHNGDEIPAEKIYECVGLGWRAILERLISDLFALGWNGQVAQVKEKFGGLRFYINGGSNAIFDRINIAENESLRTCAWCGESGKPGGRFGGGGWILTLCDKHHREREEEHRKRDQ